MDYLAIFAAGAGAYVFGAIWYGIWAKPWMAAVGLKEEDIRGPEAKQSFWPYIVAARFGRCHHDESLRSRG